MAKSVLAQACCDETIGGVGRGLPKNPALVEHVQYLEYYGRSPPFLTTASLCPSAIHASSTPLFPNKFVS